MAPSPESPSIQHEKDENEEKDEDYEKHEDVEEEEEEEEEEDYGTDYIRAVVLNECKDHVLMLRIDEDWDLPLFVYKGMLSHRVYRFCKDLQSTLAIDSDGETDFTTVFELFGSYASADHKDVQTPGYLKLMVVEYQRSQEDLDSKLPQHAEWKDVGFVSTLLDCAADDDKQISLEEVVSLLQSRGQRFLSLRESRHQFGWFERVSDVLRGVAERCGQGAVKSIVQVLMGPSSTVVRANCEKGALFLKSPLSVSREATITRKLGELFPESTPQVLEINEELNLFVTRGFQHVELSEGDITGICLEAGRLQLSSRKYVAELEAAGCKLRGPGELKRNVSGWLEDRLVRKIFRSRLDELEAFIGFVENDCDELSCSTVPMTLVHGDLYKHNATRRVYGRGYMLFDYEFAYIGHPFCEMSTICEKMTDEGIQNYLLLWLEYGSLDGLRKSFRIACRLGWAIRLWKLFDDIRVCDARKNDELASYAVDCFDDVYYAMAEDDHL